MVARHTTSHSPCHRRRRRRPSPSLGCWHVALAAPSVQEVGEGRPRKTNWAEEDLAQAGRRNKSVTVETVEQTAPAV
jgi:hypothetical protein